MWLYVIVSDNRDYPLYKVILAQDDDAVFTNYAVSLHASMVVQATPSRTLFLTSDSRECNRPEWKEC